MLRLTGSPLGPRSVRVRHAEHPDLDALVALHSRAAADHLAQRGGAILVASLRRGEGSPEVTASFVGHLGDESVEVLVAELLADMPGTGEASGPLGHAVVRFPPPDATGADVAAIEELYVEPAARGVGLGSGLLAQAMKSATERGCSGIDAVALPGDRPTKNFFEDHSMVARAIIVHTDLAPDAGSGTPSGTRDG